MVWRLGILTQHLVANGTIVAALRFSVALHATPLATGEAQLPASPVGLGSVAGLAIQFGLGVCTVIELDLASVGVGSRQPYRDSIDHEGSDTPILGLVAIDILVTQHAALGGLRHPSEHTVLGGRVAIGAIHALFVVRQVRKHGSRVSSQEQTGDGLTCHKDRE